LKFSPTGTQLGSYPIPIQTANHWMAMDASGQLWIAEGHTVWRVAPSGTILDTLTLPSDVGEVAVDPGTGTAWVALPFQSKLARFTAQGQPLSTVTVNQTGDRLGGLAVDASGNAWATEQVAGRVAKIGPDGVLRGKYLATGNPGRVLIDPAGNVLVFDATDLYNGDRPKAIRLSPDGSVANLSLGVGIPTVFDAVFDVAGHLWYLGYEANGSLNKMAL
jgi:DNA-binding beta-propeller fold protein YncE